MRLCDMFALFFLITKAFKFTDEPEVPTSFCTVGPQPLDHNDTSLPAPTYRQCYYKLMDITSPLY